MFMSVETDTGITDAHEKIDMAQLVDVFAYTAHRQMELY